MAPKETRSTCPYCGVGCGVLIASEQGQIVGVRGDPDHPANFGRLCSKGASLHLTATPALTQTTRLLQPQRRLVRGGSLQPLPWDDALQWASHTFASVIRADGPDAVGFYVSGQLLTEDYYVFNKLVKGLIGTNNIDTNSRLCMSSAVAGYKLTLGADAPPACYDDLQHAQCLFIAGSNAAHAHPVLFRRIEEARAQNPALKIIVADPRRTDTASCADLHLPLQPGTDVMLFHGLLHIMLWEGWINPGYIEAHTEGFEALKTVVRECTPEKVARFCGLRVEDLVQAARWFATASATLSLYCQGLNQSSSGTAKNAALINLHLATGQIGKPGAGPFSLTGQPNAMGGREVGGLANLLSAHRDLADPAHRAEVAALWGVPSVPATPGKTAVDMFQAAADGEIKALWIACTNPAQSMPDQTTVRRALQRAEFVVVQEAFADTSTTAFADLLLPATTWGEKEGTVTNSERRITRVRAAVPPPGQARHDWRIVVDFGRLLENEPGVRAKEVAHSLFPYETPESVWLEHRESTRGRDLDITGLSYAALEAAPQQWPCPEGATQGRPRLYEDGQFPTPSGRARFAAVTPAPLAEARESRYPFSLNTGRLRDQWHGMSRTGWIGRLFGHVPEPVVQVHPQDLARHGWQEGDLVHLTSKRGSIVVPVQSSTELGLNQAFMGMHWGSEFLSGRQHNGQPLAGVNALTTSAYCPSSKQPELKHAAVKILKAELPWKLLAVSWLPDDQAADALLRLRRLMPLFEFATCVPFGQARSGVLFRAASAEPVADKLVSEVADILHLSDSDVLHYADRKRGQRRSMRMQRSGEVSHLEGFLLAGDIGAEAWIKTLLQEGLPAQAYGRQLLSPGSKAPVGVAPPCKTVCSCVGVREDTIQAHLKAVAPAELGPEAAVASLKTKLGCGTQCGSCVPELQRLARLAQPSLTI